MTSLRAELAKLADGLLSDSVPGAPETDFTISPEKVDDAAAVLRFAAKSGLRVLFWGGGTHQGMGNAVAADVVLTTHRMSRVIDWQVEDLTIVVEPGLTVADLEAQLQQRGQTAVLPETAPGATVGGVVAAGLSGWRRLRYGPTRDRVLEVVLATGDGRVVRGGGRLVKNVTGYDLPRLVVGSLGALGLIGAVCLKLWPLAAAQGMVEVADPRVALSNAYRPLAVIETEVKAVVYLAGTSEEIAAQAERLGGRLISGHRWPDPPTGRWELSLRVPAGQVPRFVDRIGSHGWAYQAAHGVGEVRFAVEDEGSGELGAMRREAEAVGGALVVMRAPADTDLDPWGVVPESTELQRAVKAAFDPLSIANPGILPGGI
ncbi:MAG: FAD-binding oxidoreductase [Acidimicrobiia bacterium]|nr:FAD-binding oxidoreductase [Acidimicrobiia bacterium]